MNNENPNEATGNPQGVSSGTQAEAITSMAPGPKEHPGTELPETNSPTTGAPASGKVSVTADEDEFSMFGFGC